MDKTSSNIVELPSTTHVAVDSPVYEPTSLFTKDTSVQRRKAPVVEEDEDEDDDDDEEDATQCDEEDEDEGEFFDNSNLEVPGPKKKVTLPDPARKDVGRKTIQKLKKTAKPEHMAYGGKTCKKPTTKKPASIVPKNPPVKKQLPTVVRTAKTLPNENETNPVEKKKVRSSKSLTTKRKERETDSNDDTEPTESATKAKSKPRGPTKCEKIKEYIIQNAYVQTKLPKKMSYGAYSRIVEQERNHLLFLLHGIIRISSLSPFAYTKFLDDYETQNGYLPAGNKHVKLTLYSGDDENDDEDEGEEN